MWFNSTQREEPYQVLTLMDRTRDGSSSSEARKQVVHGCRQLVLRRIKLSPATSATPIVSCHHLVGHSSETAGNKPEEGGDDVKSSWPLRVGLHTCYNGVYRGKRECELERISQSTSKSGLESATRLHEVGIASNRKSECCGEYVPGPCTHRPSHHGSGLYQK